MHPVSLSFAHPKLVTHVAEGALNAFGTTTFCSDKDTRFALLLRHDMRNGTHGSQFSVLIQRDALDPMLHVGMWDGFTPDGLNEFTVEPAGFRTLKVTIASCRCFLSVLEVN